jgi:uncharacterized protein YyaL (SSP411 family)
MKIVESAAESGKKMNRLIREKSPYLLQHAGNPVDWHPWGAEAFQRAVEEDKPIFLSVGYSTCYWCHVMEREVFENVEIAATMNDYFVNIKVDREERPDIDRVYMAAVQAMNGNGGWPMSVFLTPDLKPFFGATYIPPTSRYGRIGFPELAERIHELWLTKKEEILRSGEELIAFLRKRESDDLTGTVRKEWLSLGLTQFARQYDSSFGGFGDAPKFPRPPALDFLLHYHSRVKDVQSLDMAVTTLRKMAEGGVYDHLGGGFHRYSVDKEWRVPHFEKMLYDQAQLVRAYLTAYQITGNEFLSDVARNILRYVTQNLTDRNGGFYSAEDAESAVDRLHPSEKVEGEYYLWRREEILEALGEEEGEIACYRFGVREGGNTFSDTHAVFGTKNVLFVAHSLEETAAKFALSVDQIRSSIESGKQRLRELRETRPRPHLDDKIIVSWNGLMISAFARAYQILQEPEYLNAAERAAGFIMEYLYIRSGKSARLLRRFRDGEARFEAHLVDYAFLSAGLIDLYEASFDTTWLHHAIDLTRRQIDLFYDEEKGGFWDTSGEDESILIRTKEHYDGAEPTGNSIAIANLLKLSEITANTDWRAMAEKSLTFFGSRMGQVPFAMPEMLIGADCFLTKQKHIVIAGGRQDPDTSILLREVHRRYTPNRIVLLADGGAGQEYLSSLNPFYRNIVMQDGKAAAYVCEDYVCKLPVTDAAALADQLG